MKTLFVTTNTCSFILLFLLILCINEHNNIFNYASMAYGMGQMEWQHFQKGTCVTFWYVSMFAGGCTKAGVWWRETNLGMLKSTMTVTMVRSQGPLRLRHMAGFGSWSTCWKDSCDHEVGDSHPSPEKQTHSERAGYKATIRKANHVFVCLFKFHCEVKLVFYRKMDGFDGFGDGARSMSCWDCRVREI